VQKLFKNGPIEACVAAWPSVGDEWAMGTAEFPSPPVKGVAKRKLKKQVYEYGTLVCDRREPPRRIEAAIPGLDGVRSIDLRKKLRRRPCGKTC